MWATHPPSHTSFLQLLQEQSLLINHIKHKHTLMNRHSGGVANFGTSPFLFARSQGA